MNADTTSPYAFKFEVPEGDKARSIVWLCRTDKLLADVQVLRSGGETNLHAHPHLDGFWFVLSGRARFYGDKDLIGDVGPNEGVLLPRGTKYWFEAVGPEPLQVLQIEVPDTPMKSMDEVRSDRVDYGDVTKSTPADHVEASAKS